MPADTNPYGGVFGGLADGPDGARLRLVRVAPQQGKAIVVAADELRFPGAMAVGDELSVYVDLKEQGTTSMTIAIEAIARHRDGDDEILVADGRFTFVALDDNGKPRALAEGKESNG